ncbi:MAG: DUF421 domain-containing protein [Vicinamibacterales bacterium]
MPDIDWSSVFEPTVHLLELVLRGSLIYVSVFALLRLVLKREAGALNLADLLALVLIADASQSALTADAHSVPETLVVVGTIVGWNYTFDWMAQHYPAMRRYIHPPPLPLVKDGRYIARNMRHEMITREEIESKLRLAGVADVKDVKSAFMEGDGQISVVKSDGERDQSANQDRKRATP